jgi:hypothetical protein
VSDQHKPRFVVPVQGGRAHWGRSDDAEDAAAASTRGQGVGEAIGPEDSPEDDHGADQGEADLGETDPRSA